MIFDPGTSIPADRERLDISTSVAECAPGARPECTRVSLERRIGCVAEMNCGNWNEAPRNDNCVPYRHLTPAAVESGDAVVGFDRPAALGAFGVAIAFDPVMGHGLRRFLGLDVSADARGRRPLDASLVYRVLANYFGAKES